jgi:uncharacterized protein YecE (DUF72 family)
MTGAGESARKVKIGCCGFRSGRQDYFSRFDLVEVQQTFYQPPAKPDTLRRWREEAPADFEFTMKAWQLVTHEGRSPTYRRIKRVLTEEERDTCGAFLPTAIVREGWETTRECAEALGARRILFQCPAKFTPTEEHVTNLRRFFASIERGDFIFMWEPRGAAWSPELVGELCRELRLVHVVDPFAARTTTPAARYYRLHGRGGFRYVYEEDELRELYSMLPRGAQSYVLFNNVRMAQDAERFRRIVEEEAEG